MIYKIFDLCGHTIVYPIKCKRFASEFYILCSNSACESRIILITNAVGGYIVCIECIYKNSHYNLKQKSIDSITETYYLIKHFMSPQGLDPNNCTPSIEMVV